MDGWRWGIPLSGWAVPHKGTKGSGERLNVGADQPYFMRKSSGSGEQLLRCASFIQVAEVETSTIISFVFLAIMYQKKKYYFHFGVYDMI